MGEPTIGQLKGRVSPANQKLVTWKAPPTDVGPNHTTVLYMDKEVVEITSDKPLVVLIERRRQGGADRYAIHIDVKG